MEAADSSEYSDRRTAFGDMLAELEDGRAIAHASREFLEIVEKLKVAAGLAGKAKGKINFSVELTVFENGTVSATYDVTAKHPKIPVAPTGLFIGRNGGITARNPRQLEIPGAVRNARRAPEAPLRTPKKAPMHGAAETANDAADHEESAE